MLTNALGSVRRSLPTLAIAGVLVVASATSGATAALVITGKDIKNGTVTTKDIKDDNLKSKDIKDGTLKTKDLKASTVEELKGATGAPGVSGYQIVTAAVTVPSSTGGQVVGSCPAGKKVLSAAARLTGAFTGTAVDIDLSTTYATAYAQTGAAADTLVIDVVCAVVS